MLLGLPSVGIYAISELPSGEDLSTPNPFWAFFSDEYAERVYVLECRPMALYSIGGLFPYPLGQYALGELSDVDQQAPRSLYFSTAIVETDGERDPPDDVIPARLSKAIQYRAAIPLPGGQSAQGTISSGLIRVANPDGALDESLMESSWGGRTAKIWIGGTMNPGRYDERELTFSEYQELYTLPVSSVSATHDEFSIGVTNQLIALNARVQDNTYLGDDTLYEGGEEIKGRYKPFCLGSVYKVPAVLVDATNWIYQFHDGPGASTYLAYDNGLELTWAGDVSDLIATSVSAGQFKTDAARGLLKVGTEPSSEIVCDVTGVGGTTISDLIGYLCDRLGVAYDTTSFATYGDYQAGFFCDIWGISYRSVFIQLLSGIDGWFLLNRKGEITIGEHTAVDATASVLTIDGRDNTDYSSDIVEGSLRRTAGPPPVWRLRFGYKKYGQTQDLDIARSLDDMLTRYKTYVRTYPSKTLRYKLADSVNPDQIEDWAKEYRYVDTVESTTTKTTHANAVEVERQSYLTDATEAAALASAMLSRDSKWRNLYTLQLSRKMYRLYPGDVITIKADRFNLSDGKKGRVISIMEDSTSRVTELQVLVNE